jgi:hypothetical protein
MGARPFVQQALERAMRRATLWNDHLAALLERYEARDAGPRRAPVDAARGKVVQLGVFLEGPMKSLRLAGTERTAFGKAMIEEFNAQLLGELVLPGLVAPTFHANFVDQRLTTPKAWRDVYHYEGEALTGWTRYQTGAKPRVSEFTTEGWLVVEKDKMGRPITARTVIYRQPPITGRVWANPNALEYLPGDERITFAYDGEKRTIKQRQKVEDR